MLFKMPGACPEGTRRDFQTKFTFVTLLRILNFIVGYLNSFTTLNLKGNKNHSWVQSGHSLDKISCHFFRIKAQEDGSNTYSRVFQHKQRCMPCIQAKHYDLLWSDQTHWNLKLRWVFKKLSSKLSQYLHLKSFCWWISHRS